MGVQMDNFATKQPELRV